MSTLPRVFVPDAPPAAPDTSRIGLTVFMAVATTLFSLLLLAYAMRMREPDWQPIPHPALLWWNTAALVLASAAMQRARRFTARHAAWLIAGGALAAVFVIGQLAAWRMLSAAGQTVSVNPSNSFLYLLTGPAWAARAGRARSLGLDDRASAARRPRPDRARHVAVRPLLALPARRLAGAAGGDVVDHPGLCRRHLRATVRSRAMTTPTLPTDSAGPTAAEPLAPGWRGIVNDWSADREAFKVPWGKAMMWIFLLSDTFIFSSFLIGYMTVRMSTTVPWPNPSEVFGLRIGGVEVPLLLIAIMTFVLISSSGTMAMAVNFGYRRNARRAAALMLATALLGATFVSMQAFEWTKLIVHEGIRPWGNPLGAAQFGACFFMITGFHGFHVTCGVIYLLLIARKILQPGFTEHGNFQIVEIAGLYWHFVDLVWVFIFALFYLW